MDRFSELRAFAAVVDAGGFSSAARNLGQSRSSVNRQVIALEQRLGAQLLNRTTRSVSVTGVGRAVYEKAQLVLRDLQELEQTAQSSGKEPTGKLRLSAPPTFGNPDFSQIVVDFMKAYPKVEVEARFEGRVVDLVAEGFDVVIRAAVPDEETTLVDHRLLSMKYALCASPSYLERRGTPQTLQDLAGHNALHHGTSAAPPRWSLLIEDQTVAVPVRPILYSNDMATIYKSVCADQGIAVLPLQDIQADLEAGNLIHVLPEVSAPPRELQVIHPPARYLSAKVRAFVEFVSERCAQIETKMPRQGHSEINGS